MAITYPVDVDNTEWAVYQSSTGQIIDRRKAWPRADGGEIVGLDPDFVYLLHADDAEPNYDSRLFILDGTEEVDVVHNELRLTWEVTPRPLEEQITAAENREAEQLERVVQKLAREVIETRLALGAIIRFAVKNQQFPAKVQTLIDAYEAKAIKVWSNRDVLEQKVTELQTTGNTNLDADWVE